MGQKKKIYQTLTLEVVGVDSAQPVLAASVASQSIKVNNVTVEDYKADQNFVDANQDFKTISFD